MSPEPEISTKLAEEVPEVQRGDDEVEDNARSDEEMGDNPSCDDEAEDNGSDDEMQDDGSDYEMEDSQSDDSVEDNELDAPKPLDDDDQDLEQIIQSGAVFWDSGVQITDPALVMTLVETYESETEEYVVREYTKLSELHRGLMSRIYRWIVRTHNLHHSNLFIVDPNRPEHLKFAKDFRSSFAQCLMEVRQIDGKELQLYEMALAVIWCLPTNHQFLEVAYNAFFNSTFLPIKDLTRNTVTMKEATGEMIFGIQTRYDIEQLYLGHTDRPSALEDELFDEMEVIREEGGQPEQPGVNRYVRAEKYINPPMNWRSHVLLQIPKEAPLGVVLCQLTCVVAQHGCSLHTSDQMQDQIVDRLRIKRPPASMEDIEAFCQTLKEISDVVAESEEYWPSFKQWYLTDPDGMSEALAPAMRHLSNLDLPTILHRYLRQDISACLAVEASERNTVEQECIRFRIAQNKVGRLNPAAFEGVPPPVIRLVHEKLPPKPELFVSRARTGFQVDRDASRLTEEDRKEIVAYMRESMRKYDEEELKKSGVRE